MATGNVLIGSIGKFDPEIEKFSNYLLRFRFFAEVNNVSTEKKASVFLATIGPNCFGLCKDLLNPKALTSCTFDEITGVLCKHYEPTKNIIYERFKFYSRNQKPSESLTEYIHTLKSLASSCEFGEALNEMLRDRFVVGLNDQKTQRSLLSDTKLTWDKALTAALTMEAAMKDVSAIHGSSDSKSVHNVQQSYSANSVKKKNPVQKNNASKFVKHGKSIPKNYICRSCGSTSHFRQNCKFLKAECHHCKKVGHIAKICRTNKSNTQNDKTVNKIDQNRPNDENIEYIFSINNSHKDPFMINVNCNDQIIPFELDTGASRTLIPYSAYLKYFKNVTLRRSSVKLRKYGETERSMQLKGEIQLNVVIPGTNEVTKLGLLVVAENGALLLGRDWLRSFKFSHNLDEVINKITSFNVLDGFPELFDDKLGTFKPHKVHIDVKDDVPPKYCNARPVPFRLKDKINDALDKLLQENIIEPVSNSKWSAPIVPVMKPDGSVRICGDYRMTANKVILLDSYPLPRQEDLFSRLSRGKVFSKLDMSQAYAQLLLDDDSKEITTINTHRGLFRYNRVCYGISSAPGIFQRTMENLLSKIPGICCYLDDILISASSPKEHDNRLKKVLEALSKAGLKLKKSKCTIAVNEVSYLGFIINEKGINTNPEKVRAITDIPIPTNVSQLQSYLGMLNFYRKFLSNAATLLEPLNMLLRKDVKWEWGKKQSDAFLKSKEMLLNSDVLVHFNPDLPITVSADSSSYGIGAVLCHVINGQERPVSFISRSLSDVERRYSQLEREALALVYALKKFHYFLYGSKFTLITDHLPLVSIFSKKRNISETASGRIQRWSLMLQCYDFELIHKSGKKLCTADLLSRLPLKTNVENIPVPAEWIHLVEVLNNIPVTAAEIAKQTSRDSVLSQVFSYCMNGFPCEVSSHIQPYFNKKSELVIQSGCILWGNRVVIPSKLQLKILHELHNGHIGISRMKELARSYFWWPNLDLDIENKVKSCQNCLETRQNPPKADLHPWPYPDKPWSRIHVDYAGPVDNNYFLIIIDAFSKWPEIYKTISMSASTTISCLRNCFARYGLPESVVSDNGPCFISEVFKEFLRLNGVKQILTAVYKPSTNGLAENLVKSFKNYLKSEREGDLQEKLDKFLFKYRLLPHTTTGVPPSELMFNRKIRSIFDLLKPIEIAERVRQKQEKQKYYHDPIRSRKLNLSRTDPVMVRNYTSPNKWVPGTVTEQTGPLSFKCQVGDKIVKRHQDQVIPVPIVPKPHTNQPDNLVSNDSTEITPIENSVPSGNNSPEIPLRRSMRVSRPPDRLNL